MLGRVEVTTAVGPTAGAPAIPATDQLPAGTLDLSFFVEEDEMLVTLELNAVLTPGAGALDTTFLVTTNGVTTNLGGGTALALAQQVATAAPTYVSVRKTVRLPRGQHFATVALTSTAAVTVNGDLVPAEFTARRDSHIGTLGHGVDAKQFLVQ